MNLNRNFALLRSVAKRNMEQCHAEDEMENPKDNTTDNAADNAKKSDNAGKFRDYAAECRRLAQRASEKDRAILMEIAEAWAACAEEAERKEKTTGK